MSPKEGLKLVATVTEPLYSEVFLTEPITVFLGCSGLVTAGNKFDYLSTLTNRVTSTIIYFIVGLIKLIKVIYI